MEIRIFSLIEAHFEPHTLRYRTRNRRRVVEKDNLAAYKLFWNKVYYSLIHPDSYQDTHSLIVFPKKNTTPLLHLLAIGYTDGYSNATTER